MTDHSSTLPISPRPESIGLLRIDHVGVAVPDLDAAIEFYGRVFGMACVHVETNEEQGVREAMLKINDTGDGGASYLQLLEPIREDSAIAKWMAKNGEGVHHVAFGTADVVGVTADIVGKGVRSLYEVPRRGSMGSTINFLHPKDAHGVLVELVQATDSDGHAEH